MGGQRKPELNVCNYLVVFLDLLGQKERLSELPKIVPNEGFTPELEKIIQDTYGVTFKLREFFRNFFESYENHKLDPRLLEGLTETQVGLFNRMICPTKMHLQYMGDAIVLYSKLTNQSGQLSVRPIITMLGNCALAMILQFGGGNPIRGATEIGLALDWEEFGIYGSALHSAYFLESRVAQYPRIIIGDHLLKYLRSWEKESRDDEATKVNKELARCCLSVICEDIDGRPILDFLSPALPSIFGHSASDEQFKLFSESVKKGFSFVSREYERFVSEKRSELAFRYALLRDYYGNRIGTWDEKT